MTYWATLWYAGAVVVTIGSEGQSLNDCNIILRTMMIDVESAYADPDKQEQLADSVFPTDEFAYTCETERLPIDKRYMK